VTDELAAYRREVRAWLTANLEPREPGEPSLRPDEDYTEPFIRQQRQLQRRLFDGGYAGIGWPREYGGQGLTADHETVFAEEGRRFRLPDFGKSAMTTFGVCGPTLIVAAAEDFKLRHIPRILRGEELWAQFFSEPGAGSDLAAISTAAVRDGADWVLNGAKTWSSFAHRCDFGLCLARTDPSLPKHQGLTWFAVPTSAPGLTMRQFKQIDGTDAFCEEFLDDVRISDSERVGEVNAGWSIARQMLLFERDSDGRKRTTSLAPGELAPDLVAVARARGLLADPVIRQLIATAHVNSYVVDQLYVRIEDCLGGKLAQDGMGVAAYGKLARGTFDPIRAGLGLQIAGDGGAWWQPGETGPEAAGAFLNGRIYSIAGGTNEMQRNAIAERIYRLPREGAVAPPPSDRGGAGSAGSADDHPGHAPR
jgi:alkylation response protein AidB-like acyl-CoA dehydrogenase